MINVILILISLLLLIIYFIKEYFKDYFTYWQKRHVPLLLDKPRFPLGSIRMLGIEKNATTVDFIKDLYNDGKCNNYKYGGLYMFTTPLYIPIHPEYIKSVLQKDFHHFVERGVYYNEKDDPLSANLFAISGEKWDIIRKKLSPAFTSGKIKIMFDDMLKCANQMLETIHGYCERDEAVDVRKINESFTIDVIGFCAFGLQCNSFKNPNSEFIKQGKKVFHLSLWRILKVLFMISYQNLARKLRFRLFEKDLTEFFIQIVENSLKFRNSEKCIRKDILHLLFQLAEDQNINEKGTHRLSLEELTAQVFIFFAAGFETSSLTLSFCFFELSLNLNIQEKVREEINQILSNYGGKITYEAVMEMKYLNQVVDETLRKYPPVPFLSRVCTKAYKIPNTKSTLEKGTLLAISVLGMHHDPEYYLEPKKFDPERFSDVNRAHIKPFTYLPFGEGPRVCIGQRFGLMQVKVGLIVLLRQYRLMLSKNTKVPIQFVPYTFTLVPNHEIFINLQKIQSDDENDI